MSGWWFGASVGARPTLFLLAQIDIVLDFHVLAVLVAGAAAPSPNPLPPGERAIDNPRGAVVTPAGSGSIVAEEDDAPKADLRHAGGASTTLGSLGTVFCILE